MKNLIDKKNTPQKLNCDTEYERLYSVIVAPPAYMEIKHAINKTQEHYLQDNIDKKKAMEQHDRFVEILSDNGCEVIQLEPQKGLNEQVFTRDIGFVIGETFVVSNMKEKIRKRETNVLTDRLEKLGITYTSIDQGCIEGGDILVDKNTIWVGKSGRTNEKAIDQLSQKLPNYVVNTVSLRDDILHLDCVFTILNDDYALVYSEAIDEDSYNSLKNKFTLIETTTKEQFNMGPNVLPIGQNKIISLPENKRLNRKMKQAGFQVIEVEFSEIIKSGGSFRCCTLPVKRG
ncbi:dimethylarginine dimethylaminohydrolase family protein [Virgibacillus halodenitrificans]|uniref:dimethylarginine dimethylaminohydrolase family protein n=1 Tax=Virgibacillus halodenitrificans TaxID=1482 RepID=UPI000761B884|nr:dimethylarginine dimethylaminohydrolase family protein [Virgibacillus halodenitrificans]MCG1027320.1 dimethylarginine dimethylaminohydrolase family protein [Virgibacillus halodenitrificans]MEC2159178.1 dimethylarginine dimethylaminohydrolase family protein [Virgibacillus halodenitrificans]